MDDHFKGVNNQLSDSDNSPGFMDTLYDTFWDTMNWLVGTESSQSDV